MESLIKRNIRLDNNLIDEIKTLCEDEGFTFSDLVRQVIVNDGFVVLNRIDIDIKIICFIEIEELNISI